MSATTLLMRAVLHGAVTPAHARRTNGPAVVAAASMLHDEVRFAVEVQPNTLQLVHDGAVASASIFGSSAPLQFQLDVWALDGSSKEEALLQQREQTHPAATHACIHYTMPWIASPTVGWKRLLGPNHAVSFATAHASGGHGGQTDGGELSVLLPLQLPSASWTTRRIVIRGSYMHMSVKIYGSVPLPLTATDAQTVQAAATLYRQAVLQLPTRPPADADAAPVPRVQAWAEHLVPIYAPAMREQLFYSSSDATPMANVVYGKLCGTDAGLQPARQALVALAEAMQECGLLRMNTVGQGSPMPTSLPPAALVLLRTRLHKMQQQLSALDDPAREAMLFTDDASTARLAELVRGLSFLLAASTRVSVRNGSNAAESFSALRGFVQRFSPPIFDWALIRAAGGVLRLLLRSSQTLAIAFCTVGAGWLWLLSWLENLSKPLDALRQVTAMHLVHSLLSHVPAVVLLQQQFLRTPTAAPLLEHGVLSSSSNASLSPPCLLMRSAISDAVRLLDHCASTQTLFDELLRVEHDYATAAMTMSTATSTQEEGLEEELFLAHRRLVAVLERLVAVLRDAHQDESRCRLLVPVVLQGARHFKLLTVLQQLLAMSLQSGSAVSMSPFEVLMRVVRPILMLGFFPHRISDTSSSTSLGTSASHVLMVCGPEGQLLRNSMRMLVKMLRATKSHPVTGPRPWQQVQELLDWMEGRAQALLLLHQCLPSTPTSLESQLLRVAAWNSLASFVQSHPYAADSIAAVLSEAATHVACLAEEDGLAFSSLFELHRVFHTVFVEQRALAPLMQQHAMSVFNALLSSTSASVLFLQVRGRLPTMNKEELAAFVARTEQRREQERGRIEGDQPAALTGSCDHVALYSFNASGAVLELLPKPLQVFSSLLRFKLNKWGNVEANGTLPTLTAEVISCVRTLQVARLLLDGHTEQHWVASAALLQQDELTGREQNERLQHLVQAMKEVQPAQYGVLAAFLRAPKPLDAAELAGAAAATRPPSSPSVVVPQVLGCLATFSAAFKLGATDPQALLLMLVSAEALDALLATLLSCLRFLCSSANGAVEQTAAEIEKGELEASMYKRAVVPELLYRLQDLQEALWKTHETLLASETMQRTFNEPLPAGAATLAESNGQQQPLASPPLPRSALLGFFPRVRRSLHACLSFTLWHLSTPESAAPDPNARAWPDDVKDLPPLALPEARGAIQWWQEQVFSTQKLSTWQANMYFLIDALPTPWVRSEAPQYAGSDTSAPPKLSGWASLERKRLWQVLLDQVEVGPVLPPNEPPLREEPRLVSNLIHDVLQLAVGRPHLIHTLARMLGAVLDCQSPGVARRVLTIFLAQLTTLIQQTCSQLSDAFLNLAAQQQLQDGLSPLEAANALNAKFQLAHIHAHCHLQLLHALLQFPLVRWLLLDTNVVSALQPLLVLAVPSTPASSAAEVTLHNPHMTEAIALQVLALDCCRLVLEDTPLPESEHKDHAVDAAVLTIMRMLLPDMMPLLLHSSHLISVAAVRVLLACAQSKEGCQELLGWLGNKEQLNVPLWASMGLRAPSTANAPTTPLLYWLTMLLEQWEQPQHSGGADPNASPSPEGSSAMGAVELEQWSQLSILLRNLITLAQAGQDEATEQFDGAAPAVTDAWWASRLSRIYAGLPALASALQWTSNQTPHLAADTTLVKEATQLPTPVLPYAHPLLRIATRANACHKHAKARVAEGDVDALQAVHVSLQLSTLITTLGGIIQKLQLGAVVCLQPPPPASASPPAAAVSTEERISALHRQQVRHAAPARLIPLGSSAGGTEGDVANRWQLVAPLSLPLATKPTEWTVGTDAAVTDASMQDA